MRPSHPALLAFLVAAALTSTPEHVQAQYVWNGTASSDWHDAGNWSPSYSAWGDSANLTNSVTASFGTVLAGEVQLGSDVYAHGVSFDNSGGDWSLASSGPLRIGAGGITVSNGTTTISTSVVLHANQTWDTGSGSTLGLYAPLGDDGSARALNKSGTGTLVLTGTTYHTGGTTISAGTLQLGNGASDGAIGVGGITNNGSLAIHQFSSGEVEITNPISGTGSLTRSGSGTTTLSGTNTYTGSTTVSGGTLQFATRGSLYNANSSNWTATNITVANGATLALALDGSDPFTAGDVATIAGLASGPGGFQNGSFLGLTVNSGAVTYGGVISDTSNGVRGLAKLGGGALILTGTNTYTGTTTVAGGILQLGDGTTTGSVAGNIQNDNTLYFNPGSVPLVYSGTITGGDGSISKLGTGVLTLNGSITSGFFEHQGGTLRGSGTINAPLSVSGGATVRPGTGTGADSLTLTSGGLFEAGSTLAIDVTDSTYSKLVIDGGTLDLSQLSPSNKLNISLFAVGTLTPNTPYTITVIDATNGSINYGSGFNAEHFNVTANGFAIDGDFTVLGTETGLTISFTPVPVPEPAAVLGVAVAGLAAGGFVRRRWRATTGEAAVAP